MIRRPPREKEEKWREFIRDIRDELRRKFNDDKIVHAVYSWVRRVYGLPILVLDKLSRLIGIDAIIFIVVEDEDYDVVSPIVKEIAEKYDVAVLSFVLSYDEEEKFYRGAIKLKDYTIFFIMDEENIELLKTCKHNIGLVFLPFTNFEEYVENVTMGLINGNPPLPVLYLPAKTIPKIIT